jgi:hypothetical protein
MVFKFGLVDFANVAMSPRVKARTRQEPEKVRPDPDGSQMVYFHTQNSSWCRYILEGFGMKNVVIFCANLGYV